MTLCLSQLQAKTTTPKSFDTVKRRIESCDVKLLSNLKKYGFKSITDVHRLYMEINTLKWREREYAYASIQLKKLIDSYSEKTRKLNWDPLRDQLYNWQSGSTPVQEVEPDCIIFEKSGDAQLAEKKYDLALESYLNSLDALEEKALKSSRIYIKIADIYSTAGCDVYDAASALSYYDKAIQWEEKNHRKLTLGTTYYINYEKTKLTHAHMKAGQILEESNKYTNALKYYRDAYNHKDFEAAFKIGDIYSSGKFLNTKDPKSALKYYQRGIDLIGRDKYKSPAYIEHNKKLAEYTFKYGKHDKTAIRYLEQCSLMGIAECPFYLGKVYTEVKNLNQALAWFTLSHAMGYSEAADQIIITQNKIDGQKKTYAKLFARNFVSDWKDKYPKLQIKN